jgi:hypothetical protein
MLSAVWTKPAFRKPTQNWDFFGIKDHALSFLIRQTQQSIIVLQSTATDYTARNST